MQPTRSTQQEGAYNLQLANHVTRDPLAPNAPLLSLRPMFIPIFADEEIMKSPILYNLLREYYDKIPISHIKDHRHAATQDTHALDALLRDFRNVTFYSQHIQPLVTKLNNFLNSCSDQDLSLPNYIDFTQDLWRLHGQIIALDQSKPPGVFLYNLIQRTLDSLEKEIEQITRNYFEVSESIHLRKKAQKNRKIILSESNKVHSIAKTTLSPITRPIVQSINSPSREDQEYPNLSQESLQPDQRRNGYVPKTNSVVNTPAVLVTRVAFESPETKKAFEIIVARHFSFHNPDDHVCTFIKGYSRNANFIPLFLKIEKSRVLNNLENENYGIFANEIIRKKTLLGVVTGKIMRREYIRGNIPGHFCLNKAFKNFVLDTNKQGNWTRYIKSASYYGSGEIANLQIIWHFYERRLFFILEAKQHISPGEELLY